MKKTKQKRTNNPTIAHLVHQLMRQNSGLTMREAADEARRLYAKGITNI